MNNYLSSTNSTEQTPVRLVALIGSLRAESANRAVFNAASDLVPEGVTLVEAPLAEVPLYNGDIEADGDPLSVQALKAAIASADGVVIFTPEYNRSIPAVTKNAIDWASRFPGDSAIGDKPVAVVGASPGGHEVQGVRDALAHTLAGAGAVPFTESIGIGGVFGLIEDGVLSDADTRDSLASYLERFVASVTERVAEAAA